ncbi:hypothetical protein AN960_20315 [Bacillus sp. FJAT-25509]|uniref:hypothetical protein n=1 Tax=Bacillus sp. FJAT-25509 TaxID=1712029 RepID=UPI0007018AAE|nr:hypothetical protein [Bacillus sp. FJAT-25509]KQL33985.1 hypothetical protein AN960_20315 [Bacillus sp. FJAT-25509]
MKKFNTIKILIIFILVFLTSGCNSPNKTFLLRGTFLCKELPFESIVFDPENDYTFYYYYEDLQGNGKLDKGTYLRKTESQYIIQSSIFNKVEITYKNSGFKIMRNEKTYYFKQIDANPYIQTNYESREFDCEKNSKFTSLFKHLNIFNFN